MEAAPGHVTGLNIDIQREIWDSKYRFDPIAGVGGGRKGDENINDTWKRIASALADAETKSNRARYYEEFVRALYDFKFIPAGRIVSGAGTGRMVTLFNCYVSGTIPDSIDGIFTRLKEAALTQQQGGGIGQDFSTIRPKNAIVRGVAAKASGPLSFMDCWDSMCKTIMSAGARRGAMMATLRCDHPDILEFVEAKRDPLRFRNFNLSVLVTDAFMAAVQNKQDWELVFGGRVHSTINAGYLWDRIVRCAYDCAEPGVIFIDRINDDNNLAYCEVISCTNPCAEQPLPPFGACLLGSINLTAFVRNPFERTAKVDVNLIQKTTATAVRMLDNVIDVSNYPLAEQKKEAMDKRRIGLGITGLGDTLAMCGLNYGSTEACRYAAALMAAITNAAYTASEKLAEEKGSFPLYDTRKYTAKSWLRATSMRAIEHRGMRNSHLISIAPTGTISLLAGNISGGIEPIYATEFERKVLQPDGSHQPAMVEDFAVKVYHALFGRDASLPSFITENLAEELSPEDHIGMQAALQPYVDSAISKTVNCKADMKFEAFQDLYQIAFDKGLKSLAAYRPNAVTGSVLSSKPEHSLDEVRKANGAGEPESLTIAQADQDGERRGLARRDSALRDSAEQGRLLSSSEDDTPLLPLSPRQESLAGRTYKLRWPLSPHAMYVTINDCDGRPYEIFINSKNLEHYSWTVAITRMVSAIWRRGGDTTFVTEELKAVFDPKGGAWVDGRYVGSVIAAIGDIIEQHVGPTGSFAELEALLKKEDPRPVTVMPDGSVQPALFCPRCHSANVRRIKVGCVLCYDCQYSNCE